MLINNLFYMKSRMLMFVRYLLSWKHVQKSRSATLSRSIDILKRCLDSEKNRPYLWQEYIIPERTISKMRMPTMVINSFTLRNELHCRIPASQISCLSGSDREVCGAIIICHAWLINFMIYDIVVKCARVSKN